jgi:hypothetical protein
MKIKRLLILAVMLGLLLCSSSKETARADAGGACLGQWSECRMTCEKNWGGDYRFRWDLAICNATCDVQRNSCLGHAPAAPPDN